MVGLKRFSRRRVVVPSARDMYDFSTCDSYPHGIKRRRISCDDCKQSSVNARYNIRCTPSKIVFFTVFFILVSAALLTVTYLYATASSHKREMLDEMENDEEENHQPTLVHRVANEMNSSTLLEPPSMQTTSKVPNKTPDGNETHENVGRKSNNNISNEHVTSFQGNFTTNPFEAQPLYYNGSTSADAGVSSPTWINQTQFGILHPLIDIFNKSITNGRSTMDTTDIPVDVDSFAISYVNLTRAMHRIFENLVNLTHHIELSNAGNVSDS